MKRPSIEGFSIKNMYTEKDIEMNMIKVEYWI